MHGNFALHIKNSLFMILSKVTAPASDFFQEVCLVFMLINTAVSQTFVILRIINSQESFLHALRQKLQALKRKTLVPFRLLKQVKEKSNTSSLTLL